MACVHRNMCSVRYKYRAELDLRIEEIQKTNLKVSVSEAEAKRVYSCLMFPPHHMPPSIPSNALGRDARLGPAVLACALCSIHASLRPLIQDD